MAYKAFTQTLPQGFGRYAGRRLVPSRTDKHSDSVHYVTMITPIENDKDAAGQERAISSLAESSGAPLAEVRGLFTEAMARLKLGATVHTFLNVLAISKVGALLRRRRLAAKRS